MALRDALDSSPVPSRLLLAAAAALACCGPAVDAGPAAGAPAPLHLSIVVAYRQANPNGSYELREVVYAGARQSGEGSVRCSRPLGGRRLCSGSVTLEQGLIDFAGSIYGSGATTRFAITGGDGRYRRTRGTVVSVFSRGGTRVAETVAFY
jgi:hypothetical protein